MKRGNLLVVSSLAWLAFFALAVTHLLSAHAGPSGVQADIEATTSVDRRPPFRLHSDCGEFAYGAPCGPMGTQNREHRARRPRERRATSRFNSNAELSGSTSTAQSSPTRHSEQSRDPASASSSARRDCSRTRTYRPSSRNVKPFRRSVSSLLGWIKGTMPAVAGLYIRRYP
jgi:hypothetical protein